MLTQKLNKVISIVLLGFLTLTLILIGSIKLSWADNSDCIATSNLLTNTLHIPCLEFNGLYYQANFRLISWDPVQLELTDFGLNNGNLPTMNDFVGMWEGYGNFVSSIESWTAPMTFNIAIANDGNSLNGTIAVQGDDPGTIQINGTVTNGIFTFDLPNSDPGHPDCTRWDVTAETKLDESLNTMSFNAPGIYCGEGGGSFGITAHELSQHTNYLNRNSYKT